MKHQKMDDMKLTMLWQRTLDQLTEKHKVNEISLVSMPDGVGVLVPKTELSLFNRRNVFIFMAELEDELMKYEAGHVQFVIIDHKKQITCLLKEKKNLLERRYLRNCQNWMSLTSFSKIQKGDYENEQLA